jgi:hypothetical protein
LYLSGIDARPRLHQRIGYIGRRALLRRDQACVGIVKVGRRDDWLGYGERARPAHPDRVYVSVRKGAKPEEASGRHCKAKWRTQVDAFWDAGIAAGGSDDGPPGLRNYHASYYAAFPGDPDGNRIEAVCQHPM